MPVEMDISLGTMAAHSFSPVWAAWQPELLRFHLCQLWMPCSPAEGGRFRAEQWCLVQQDHIPFMYHSSSITILQAGERICSQTLFCAFQKSA